MDRPILAGMVIDPLFREFITLEPYNERKPCHEEEIGSYADYDGFLIGENTFAGKRTYERGQVNLAILEDMGWLVGQYRSEFPNGEI